MDLEHIILREISQKRQIPSDISYIWYLKKEKQNKTHQLVIARGRGWWVREMGDGGQKSK